jgi:3-hydroxyisobutyrate dehydrogenase-like beta-hydroxyacid dehydrogenase
LSLKHVAFLGTGIMGSHMARRLAGAGFIVHAWNRSRHKAEALLEHRVEIAETPSAAVASADATIVMLSIGEVVDDILFRADQAGGAPADAFRRDSTLVVMSSIPVEACRAQAARLAERRVRYVDAPVSGGEVGARDGTLAILAGGSEDAIGELAPLFTPLGRVTRIGPVGSGQMAKLANQIIVGGTMVAVAEALHFAKVGGADIGALRRALLGGFGDSKILNIHGQRMVEGNFVPGSPAQYQLKDMQTAATLAGGLGLKLTLLETLLDIFGGMIARGDGGIDVSGVLLEIERRSRHAKPNDS